MNEITSVIWLFIALTTAYLFGREHGRMAEIKVRMRHTEIWNDLREQYEKKIKKLSNPYIQDLKKEAEDVIRQNLKHIDGVPDLEPEKTANNIIKRYIDRTWNLAMERAATIAEEKHKESCVPIHMVRDFRAHGLRIATAINKEKV